MRPTVGAPAASAGQPSAVKNEAAVPNSMIRKPSYASYPPLPLGKGGDTYYDDNTWVALDLVQAHRMRVAGLMGGREVVLERARTLFELVAAGWCRDPRPYPGAGG